VSQPQGALASPRDDLATLLGWYRLCARTEGKSPKTIDIVSRSVGYLEAFMASQGAPTGVDRVGPQELRAFTLYLMEKRCFSGHRFTRPQERGLSGHTINCYLRSIRPFFSWLVSERIIP